MMTDYLLLLIIAVFLPLFPLSMLFNFIYQYFNNVWLRSILLIIWPLTGLMLIDLYIPEIPDWFANWALFSSILYGFRSLVVREIGVWTGFLATSAWSLIWITLAVGLDHETLLLHALAFSLPLALLAFSTTELERRYESAFAGIVHGIAQAQPKLAGIMAISLLATIGSPLFPSFFTMLDSFSHVVHVMPAVAIGLAVVWFLWSWSGVQLLQEVLVGTEMDSKEGDLSSVTSLIYGSLLLGLLFCGLYFSRLIL